MAKRSKRQRANLQMEGYNPDRPYPLTEAVNLLKKFKGANFDESVEIAMKLGIDPRQADQLVRGSLSLPHGIGQTRRVIAFCQPDLVDAAKEAGAVEAGGEELVNKISDGWFEFDVAIASPDMMRVVSKLGRVLGPKGLMPSPKSGTVTPDVATAVRDYAAGKVEFRNDDSGNVHAVVGKRSFEAGRLAENAQAFIDQIVKMKPSSSKGVYLQNISLAATMTPGVRVEI